MPKTKVELLAEAQEYGLDVDEDTPYQELRSTVASARNGSDENDTEVQNYDDDTFGGPNRVFVDRNTDIADYVNTDTNAREWSLEDQQELEKELSEDGINARVIQSVRNYVKIKFFYNNKPLGTYKSRNFKKAQAQAFLNKLKRDYVG